MWLIFSFFTSILLLFIAWTCLRKSMLDASRDSLFDIRERVRDHFLREGWGLDCIEYKRIRDLINCAIRYAEDRSLLRVIRINRIISKNKIVSESLKSFKKEILSSDNADISIYLKKTYKALSDEIFIHLLLSTAPIAFLFFIILVICLMLSPIMHFHKLKPNVKDDQMGDFLATAAESNHFALQPA